MTVPSSPCRGLSKCSMAATLPMPPATFSSSTKRLMGLIVSACCTGTPPANRHTRWCCRAAVSHVHCIGSSSWRSPSSLWTGARSVTIWMPPTTDQEEPWLPCLSLRWSWGWQRWRWQCCTVDSENATGPCERINIRDTAPDGSALWERVGGDSEGSMALPLFSWSAGHIPATIYTAPLPTVIRACTLITRDSANSFNCRNNIERVHNVDARACAVSFNGRARHLFKVYVNLLW